MMLMLLLSLLLTLCLLLLLVTLFMPSLVLLFWMHLLVLPLLSSVWALFVVERVVSRFFGSLRGGGDGGWPLRKGSFLQIFLLLS
jgi:hypothetical protein